MELLLPSFGTYLLIVLIWIIIFLVHVIVIRWLFRINKQVKLQERQLAMLSVMAMKLGVEKEVIDEIITR